MHSLPSQLAAGWMIAIAGSLLLPGSRALVGQTQPQYPYPSPANMQPGGNQANTVPAWRPPGTPAQPAAYPIQPPPVYQFQTPAMVPSSGQPMAVPFSGGGFSSPSLTQDFQTPAVGGPGLTNPWQNSPPPGTLGGPPVIGSGVMPPVNSPSGLVNLPNDVVYPGAVPGTLPLDIDVYVPQGPTGRFMVGGTYGSDNGLIGELIIDERDFDIMRFPRSFNDWKNPGIWRGGGQTLRMEIVPGSDLERYVINFADPYLFNTNTSFSLSGYYFDRQFFDWDEQRAGGKIGIGRSLTNYLSLNAGLQLEQVTIDNLRLNTSPQLNADVGKNDLNMFHVGLVYDTRQSPYLVDSGSYLGLTYRQAFGDYSFARGEVDYRFQKVLYQHTPTSGHHTFSYRTKLGFTGSSAPVFENYFAGGLSSMRGFGYRGVSPIENGVRVGGEFQWLNSLEYQFPVTYDDMISAVMFVDFGTVEESVDLNSENFRVAPGVGLRVDVPFAGMSAPLAFDFAFPVSDATGDEHQTFSFMIGYIR